MPKTPSKKSASIPGIPWTVTVHLDDAGHTPLADALVTLMIDESRTIGLEATTDGRGRARFSLGPKVVHLDALHVTGVLARRLAASPVLALPRDAARATAIVALATAQAEDVGLHAHMQGAGLAR